LLLITSRIAIRLFSFNKILLFIKKLAFDGFYPLLVVLKKSTFVVEKKNRSYNVAIEKKLHYGKARKATQTKET